MRERKHILNVKLNRISKIKKGKEYKFQSSNLSNKEKFRKQFEKESKVINDRIRDMKNEKQILIRLREINNRLIRENKEIRSKLEEKNKLSDEEVQQNKEQNVIINDVENSNNNTQSGWYANRFLKSVIQNLRKWLTML